MNRKSSSSASSIEQMTDTEVNLYLANLSDLAKKEKNLEILFGSNGLSGRGATGNYTLISRATGLHRVHIGRILSGRCSPSLKTLKIISQVTTIGIEDIERYISRKRVDRDAAREKECAA